MSMEERKARLGGEEQPSCGAMTSGGPSPNSQMISIGNLRDLLPDSTVAAIVELPEDDIVRIASGIWEKRRQKFIEAGAPLPETPEAAAAVGYLQGIYDFVKNSGFEMVPGQIQKIHDRIMEKLRDEEPGT